MTLNIPSLTVLEWADPVTNLKARREIQKHFSDTGIYIPMEDIVSIATTNQSSHNKALLTSKVCGKGQLAIWLPLEVRLPVFGSRVFEWCWVPKM